MRVGRVNPFGLFLCNIGERSAHQVCARLWKNPPSLPSLFSLHQLPITSTPGLIHRSAPLCNVGQSMKPTRIPHGQH